MVRNLDDRSGQVEGRLLPDNARRTAGTYKEHIPWANEAAMAISMGINNAFHSQTAALQRFFAAERADHSQARYTVLRILHFAEGERLTLNEIRSELAVTSGNITFLADSLEKTGLAQRVPRPTDRRVTELQLTPEGSALAEVLVQVMARYMEQTTRGFSAEEMQQFLGFLDRFHRNTMAIASEGRTAD